MNFIFFLLFDWFYDFQFHFFIQYLFWTECMYFPEFQIYELQFDLFTSNSIQRLFAIFHAVLNIYICNGLSAIYVVDKKIHS